MPESDARRSLRRRLLVVPVAILVAAWALLYLPHLRTSPRWYGDETLTLTIGQSLFAGHPADRALKVTFWHPSYPYQPAYAWLAGGMSWLAGGDIVGARVLNTLIALAIALLIALGSRRILGHIPALFGALLFLAYDQSVIHFRWIYPHNAVALGFVICVLALMRRSAPRADWTGGLGLAVAALGHPLFAHGAIAAWLSRIRHPRSWLRLAVPPAIAIGSSLGFAVWLYWPENWIPRDLSEMFGFYRTASETNSPGTQALANIAVFYTQDMFHIGAFAGALICLTRRALRPVAVFVAVVSVLLMQNRANLTVFYYQAAILLPILALAWAAALAVIIRRLRRLPLRAQVAHGAALACLMLPAYFLAHNLPAVLRGQLVSRNDHWVTQDCHEVDRAAAWLNARVSPDDLVICGPNLGWLLHCRVTDLIQATAWQGKRTFTFDVPVSREKFLFPAEIAQARYVVIGDIEVRWTLAQENVLAVSEEISTEQWPIVWQEKNYLIVENPRRAGSGTD